jgi:exodeoxyribonuclease VIII
MEITPELLRQVVNKIQGTEAVLEGEIDDLENEAYHAGEGVSSSDLKIVISHSVLHWIVKKLLVANKGSKAKDLGSGIHAYSLEPDKFKAQYVVAYDPYPDESRKNDELKALLRARGLTQTGNKADMSSRLRAYEDGVEFISEYDMKAVQILTDKMHHHPETKDAFKEGRHEKSFYWDEDGVLCKVRTDILLEDGPSTIIFDVKSAVDASEEAFRRSVIKYSYEISAAFYCTGVSAVIDHDVTDFRWIVAETSPPYDIAVYQADLDWLRRGQLLFEEALEQLRRVPHWKGEHLGYPQRTKILGMPQYLKSK